MAQLPDSPVGADVANRLKVRVRELTILHEIARAVTSVLDFQSVLNRIVEAAVYLTNAEEGFIMLVDEESNELRLRAGKGLGDKAAKVMSMTVKDSLTGQVISTGKPLRMGGGQKTDSYKVKTGYLVKSILNVPIKGQNRVLGVLSVDHAIESFKTFSDHDVNLLTSLAEYAAIAIENARRYEQAARRADELAQSLEEIDARPEPPSKDADREALEKFNQGLRNQHQQVTQTQELITSLASDLRGKVKGVEEIARRLRLWNEEVDNLFPQLDWIAQTALARKGTGPLDELPSADSELINTLKTVLTHTPLGVLLCDVKGKILETNPAALGILQRAAEDLVNQPLSALAPADATWEHLVGSLRLALALGKKKRSSPPPSSATLYLGAKIIKAVLSPTGTHRSNSVALVVLLRDLSLETEGWRARDEALNSLSENLRTPMAAISSYTDLLLSESVGLITKAQRRFLERVRQGVDKMEAHLIDLTSQPSYIPTISEPGQISLTEAFAEAIESAKEELVAARVSLNAALPPSLPPVQIVAEHFTKIMSDLLLKAGTHARPKETINLTTSVQEENEQPAYLVIAINNPTPHPNA
ncbi:MAG: GAF domain-containing protein, partial [Anaerolineae bacterium]